MSSSQHFTFYGLMKFTGPIQILQELFIHASLIITVSVCGFALMVSIG